MSTTLLLLQLIVILGTARIGGWLLHHLGQPSVVGEMAAGMVPGPVVMGALLPEVHGQLFAKASLGGLSALSTVGLVLFMGAALSITAFPVMARILKDRGLTGTGFGQLSLSAAAVVDVVAWIVLAFAVALTGAQGSQAGLLKIMVGAVLLAGLVYGGLRPFFAWLLRTHAPDGEPSTTVLASLMIGLLGCALLTEGLHLHAVFGAFLFGTCLPRDDRLPRSLAQRIEPLSIVVLMPLFFVLVGLAAGLIGPELFTMLLVMALVTTAMTGPLSSLTTRRVQPGTATAELGS